MVECPLCDRQFVFEQILFQHVLEDHSSFDRPDCYRLELYHLPLSHRSEVMAYCWCGVVGHGTRDAMKARLANHWMERGGLHAHVLEILLGVDDG